MMTTPTPAPRQPRRARVRPASGSHPSLMPRASRSCNTSQASARTRLTWPSAWSKSSSTTPSVRQDPDERSCLNDAWLIPPAGRQAGRRERGAARRERDGPGSYFRSRIGTGVSGRLRVSIGQATQCPLPPLSRCGGRLSMSRFRAARPPPRPPTWPPSRPRIRRSARQSGAGDGRCSCAEQVALRRRRPDLPEYSVVSAHIPMHRAK